MAAVSMAHGQLNSILSDNDTRTSSDCELIEIEDSNNDSNDVYMYNNGANEGRSIVVENGLDLQMCDIRDLHNGKKFCDKNDEDDIEVTSSNIVINYRDEDCIVEKQSIRLTSDLPLHY